MGNGDGAVGRGAALVRALKLMRRLEGCRTAPALKVLANEFAVHERTIRRDLEAIEEAGWPLPQWRQDRAQMQIVLHRNELIPALGRTAEARL